MNKVSKAVFLLLVIIGITAVYFVDSDTALATKPIAVQQTLPPQLDSLAIDFRKQVKPILDQRCVVCHACYDAPCQLKLGSIEGIARGANKARVYDGERLIEANLTRLFEDAHSLETWRDKDFFPIVSDAPTGAHENLASSVMAELLALKQSSPLPKQPLLPQEIALEINREYQCPKLDELTSYKEDYPLWGMPYGLPKLTKEEHETLSLWIAKGAKGGDELVLSDDILKKIDHWEAFLNQDDLKSQLMSRYLFEHLFLVNLHFDDFGVANNTSQKKPQFFKMVRSISPPGKAVEGIYTRRPFDDPKVKRVYYRIIPVTETLVHKSHMPFLLTADRMQKWKTWFIEPEYTVEFLPSYLPEEASNPFITFAQLPVDSRYRYMLDESQNTIMQFIKGPVCRGQMALNVINDHFWVLFADPRVASAESNNQFLQDALQNISLPAEEQSNALPTAWIKYAKQERKYLQAKSEFIDTSIDDSVEITLDLLWDGEGTNDNLALTVFRHSDAASVVKGLVGNRPQTAWILTYPLFERIHYLLVAGYDVYGNVGHQLNSRMYMDFLRMEGEFNFLSFLPQKAQKATRKKWYRGSVSKVEDFVYQANESQISSDIEYKTSEPLTELYALIQDKVADVQSRKHLKDSGFQAPSLLSSFERINKLVGGGLFLLPESTLIEVYRESSNERHIYTMLRHSAHSNISHLFGEQERRLFEEDTVTIASGFMTSHPNAFLRIEEGEVDSFATQLASMKTAEDYTRLLDRFGIRRSHPRFWDFADNLHTYFSDHYPNEAAYLDFNRLENR